MNEILIAVAIFALSYLKSYLLRMFFFICFITLELYDKKYTQKIPVTKLGECEENCGGSRQCAYPYKCARSTPNKLKKAGYNPKSAYCDTSSSTKPDSFFCYDPSRISMKPCPSDVSWDQQGQSCDPAEWTDSCLITPIDSSYFCKNTISQVNDTHYTCAATQSNAGYASCFCLDNGTDTVDYVIMCASSTECFGQQCV